MGNPRFTLVEPLLQQETVTCGVRCGRILLVLVPLLTGFGLASSLVPHIRATLAHQLWLGKQPLAWHAAQEAAVTMPWNYMQPLRAQQFPRAGHFMQPGRVQQSMQMARPWHSMPARQYNVWQEMSARQYMPSVRASADVAVASEDIPNTAKFIDEFLKQARAGVKNDAPESGSKELVCSVNSRGASGRVTKLDGLDEFLSIQRCNAGRLVVCKFFTRWCKSCMRMAPKFTQLAEEFPEVRFFEVDVTSNIGLANELNIKKLPWVQVYRGADGNLDSAEGNLENFMVLPKNITVLKEKLTHHEEIQRAMLSMQPAR